MMAGNRTNDISPLQKLWGSVLALGLLVIIGMMGFSILEEMSPLDGLYLSVITLSPVGYSEAEPLGPPGKFFAIVLIVLGVTIGAFTASAIGQIVMEGQFRELVERRKMDNKLKKISGHYIVAGYGRVGRQVVDELYREAVETVIIDRIAPEIGHLSHERVLWVQGDATEEDVLNRAEIKKAHTLISTLPDEAHNVYLTLTARDMNRNIRIIARADYEHGEKKLVRAGADYVVSPHLIGGSRMAMAALRPNVVDFIQMTTLAEGGLGMEELLIPANSYLAGSALKDSNLKKDFDATLIGVKQSDGQMAISPGPNTVLGGGDIMLLIGPTEGLNRLSKALE